MLDIAIVASHSGSVRRLPEAFHRSAHGITYIGPPDDPLHRSDFVTSSIAVGTGQADFIRSLVLRGDLLDALPPWTLWGSDVDLLRMARSGLPAETKTRILPARTELGLTMLGSKTGLARITASLGLPQPRFAVVDQPADWPQDVATWPGPTLVKGERGAGSDRIRTVAIPEHLQADVVPAFWYPLVVQEHIDGEVVAVEAMFAHGRLAAWLYSEIAHSEDPLGRSTARAFRDPASGDFATTLDALAQAAGLHGLANCTFIRPAGTDRHLLLEVDMRANAWFQFGPALGVDWTVAMTPGPTPGPPVVHPRFGPGGSRRLHLYPREPVHALDRHSWVTAKPWLTRAPGTWDTRNHRDRAVNTVERAEVWQEVSRLPGRALGRLRRST